MEWPNSSFSKTGLRVQTSVHHCPHCECIRVNYVHAYSIYIPQIAFGPLADDGNWPSLYVAPDCSFCGFRDGLLFAES
jgi:hypothetical protein